MLGVHVIRVRVASRRVVATGGGEHGSDAGTRTGCVMNRGLSGDWSAGSTPRRLALVQASRVSAMLSLVRCGSGPKGGGRAASLTSLTTLCWNAACVRAPPTGSKQRAMAARHTNGLRVGTGLHNRSRPHRRLVGSQVFSPQPRNDNECRHPRLTCCCRRRRRAASRRTRRLPTRPRRPK